jgi:biopolymer transport protein ExbD
MDRYSFLEDSAPDMTPLIDCVLLLLVFFMVTTAFLSLRAIEVNMPGTSLSERPAATHDLNVYVTAAGAIQVQGRHVPLDRLRDVLAESARAEGLTTLILETAAGVRHERVIAVLDQARAAGIQEIVFATMAQGQESDNGS